MNRVNYYILKKIIYFLNYQKIFLIFYHNFIFNLCFLTFLNYFLNSKDQNILKDFVIKNFENVNDALLLFNDFLANFNIKKLIATYNLKLSNKNYIFNLSTFFLKLKNDLTIRKTDNKINSLKLLEFIYNLYEFFYNKKLLANLLKLFETIFLKLLDILASMNLIVFKHDLNFNFFKANPDVQFKSYEYIIFDKSGITAYDKLLEFYYTAVHLPMVVKPVD